jgi:hypothetical protein
MQEQRDNNEAAQNTEISRLLQQQSTERGIIYSCYC